MGYCGKKNSIYNISLVASIAKKTRVLAEAKIAISTILLYFKKNFLYRIPSD